MASLEAPGETPVTNAEVLEETDEVARPPRAVMACWTPSRFIDSSPPVTTSDSPERVWGISSAGSGSARLTRPSPSLAKRSRLSGSSIHSVTEPAMVSPMPSIAARSSSVAAAMWSIDR